VERAWKSEVDLGEVELRRVPIDPDMAIRIPLQLVLSIVRALDAVRECLVTDIGSRRDALMSPIATSGFSQECLIRLVGRKGPTRLNGAG
jgi:hypothetical protein